MHITVSYSAYGNSYQYYTYEYSTLHGDSLLILYVTREQLTNIIRYTGTVYEYYTLHGNSVLILYVKREQVTNIIRYTGTVYEYYTLHGNS